MTKVSDPGQYTRYSFDANGNRRRGLTQYVDNGGATRMVDNWYTYDRENRITLTQGELVDVKNAQGAVTGQQIQITARQGQQLAYDTHGNRRSATSMTASGNAGSAVTEFYTFDDDNRLVGTFKNGLMVAGRAYDGAGRMTDYITYTASGAIDSRRENLYSKARPARAASVQAHIARQGDVKRRRRGPEPQRLDEAAEPVWRRRGPQPAHRLFRRQRL